MKPVKYLVDVSALTRLLVVVTAVDVVVIV